MRVFIRWIPALLVMGGIFYMSHQTGSTLGGYLPFFQKIAPWISGFDWAHFVAYFILAMTIYLGLGKRFANFKGRLLTVVIATLYGVSDEIHQIFIEGRTATITDVRNDAIGAAIAMLFVSIPAVHRLYITMLDKLMKSK